jgi:hypothetical protein
MEVKINTSEFLSNLVKKDKIRIQDEFVGKVL